MGSYREALEAYLAADDRTQAKLAEAAQTSQPTINRYATGARFPDADMARTLDTATAGAVPFALWQREAARRHGLELPDQAAAA